MRKTLQLTLAVLTGAAAANAQSLVELTQRPETTFHAARIIRPSVARLRGAVKGLATYQSAGAASGELGIVPALPGIAGPFARFASDVQTLRVYRMRSGTSVVLFPEIVVQFRSALPDRLIDSFLRLSCGALGIKRIAPQRYLLSMPLPDSLQGVLTEILRKNPHVEWAEQNYYYVRKASAGNFDVALPDASLVAAQWARNSPNFGLQSAWEALRKKDPANPSRFEKGSSAIRVAVVDDGVALDHPSLKSRIVASVDVPAEAGRGFVNLGDQQRLALPHFERQHGTPVAGIIAAGSPGGGRGVEGVAPGVSLVAIRAWEYSLNGQWSTSNGLYLARAIERALDLKADIINCSWSTLDVPSLANQLNRAAWGRNGKGTVLVFSAGNAFEASTDYVAEFPASKYGIAVAATNTCNGRKDFTDCDKAEVWASLYKMTPPSAVLFAPGIKMPTTLNPNQFVRNFNGTSAAAPFVAGVAALLLTDDPSLKASDVRARLLAGARKPPGTSFAVVNAFCTLRPADASCHN